jgi:choline dehydrogenase-like flavoprotein
LILDAAELAPNATLHADLCIVGGGAAGITLALHFAGTRRQVVLLESGGLAPHSASQALAAGERAPSTRHPAPHLYRPRRLGGATTLWGGRCVPFDPIDFTHRPWLPGPGWPIAFAEVAAQYPAAAALCEAGEAIFTAAPHWPDILPGFSGRSFTSTTIERFSCPTDFGTRYRARLADARNLQVVLHANATQIECATHGGAVTAILARTLSGARFTVRARAYVLATGGLEIPRLLLASRDRHPAGIGNAHGHVGRHYMCHLAGTLGSLRPTGQAHHGYHLAQDGTYCRRRFALTPLAQRRLGIGNVAIRLHHPPIADPAHRSGPLSALYLAAPFVTPEYATRLTDGAPRTPANLLRHTANITIAPYATAAFLLHWLRRRTLATRKFPSIIVTPPRGVFTLDIHAEQLPNPDSRVTLGQGRDPFGQPMLRVDWRHLPADIDTVRLAVRALREDLAGAATLTVDEDTIEAQILKHGAYGGHHIGTARMSAAPQNGVVDADCRVHGMENLYIAGSAVFPTSGQANPTLTIVALALRLAKHLESKAFFFEKKKQKTFIQ